MNPDSTPFVLNIEADLKKYKSTNMTEGDGLRNYLSKRKVYYRLRQVLDALCPDRASALYQSIIKEYRQLLKSSSASQVRRQIGIFLMGNSQWWVVPHLFIPYLEQREIRFLPEGATLEMLYQMASGRYRLSHVLPLLKDGPFSKEALRSRLRRNDLAENQAMGVEKLKGIGWVVVLPTFTDWLQGFDISSD